MKKISSAVFAIFILVSLILWMSNRHDAEHQNPLVTSAVSGSDPQPEGSETEEPSTAAANQNMLVDNAANAADPPAQQSVFRPAKIVLREPVDPAAKANLQPRKPQPKEKLRLPDGKEFKIVVKFVNELAARSREEGAQLSIAAEEIPPGLPEVINHYGLQFYPLINPPQAKQLKQRAEQNSLREQADFEGILAVRAGKKSPDQILETANDLLALNSVEYVFIDSLDAPPPPPVDIAPPTGDYTSLQSYFGSSALDVDYAHSRGYFGQGVRVSDCEYGYKQDHEDLAPEYWASPAGPNAAMSDAYQDHGTASMGILAGGNNGYGVTGIAYSSDPKFYTEWPTTGYNRVAAIALASTNSASGDVILLEMQTAEFAGGDLYGPAELNQGVWDVVKASSDAGVIVVAAAGNGNRDLDSSTYATYRARGDSGSIIVGAGTNARAKRSYSTYGVRVDVQNWGGGVMTTGYGGYRDLDSERRQTYTSSFSGTSSASALTAGVVTSLQSAANGILGRDLSPGEMRQILKDTGRAQTGSGGNIGPMPDMRAAILSIDSLLPVPEIDLRYYSSNLGVENQLPSGFTTIDSGYGTDFGSVEISSPYTATFRLYNTGGTTLVTAGSSNSDRFTITGLSASIAQGTYDDFQVTFSPDSLGTVTATISINNNDPDESPYTFQVRGTGLPPVFPDIDIRYNSTNGNDGVPIPDGYAVIDVASGTDLGPQSTNFSTSRNFEIYNKGDSDLTVSGVGDSSDHFFLTWRTWRLEPGGRGQFTVTFSPNSVGPQTATITIVSNDSDESRYTFNVSGVGEEPPAPEIELRYGGLTSNEGVVIESGANEVSEASGTDLGVLDGGTSVTRTFRIYNTGDGALSLGAPQVTGDFLVSDLASTIAPGSFDDFTVSFTAYSPGLFTGTVSIANSDDDEGVFTFNLQARAKHVPITDGFISRDVIVSTAAPEDVVLFDGAYYYSDYDGSYYGLIFDGTEGQLNAKGDCTARVSKTKQIWVGNYTLSLVYEGVKYAVKGTVSSTLTITGSFTKKDENRSAMLFSGRLVKTRGGHRIDGQISGDGSTTPLIMFKKNYHARRNPASQAGLYSIIMPGERPGIDPTQPTGDGFAYGKMSATGVMRTSMVLGDGTKATTTARLSPDGEIFLYRKLYRRNAAGWIGGIIHPVSESNVAAGNGLLHWVKGADSRQKLYPGGFDREQSTLLSRYLPPATKAKERVLSELADTEENAVINFRGGNVDAVPGKTLTWDPKNKITHSSDDPDQSLTVKVKTSNGTLTGRYRNKSTGQDLRFSGISIQEQGLVTGHFIGDGETGRIIIDSTFHPLLTLEKASDASEILPGSTLDLGSVGVDGGFSEAGIIIRNTGEGALYINGTPEIAADDGGFLLSQFRHGSIPAGGSAMLRVVFDPAVTGEQNGTLTIHSNDEGASPTVVNLSGTGVTGSAGTGREMSGVSNISTPGDPLVEPGTVSGSYDSTEFPGNYYGLVRRDIAGARTVGYVNFKVTHSTKLDSGQVSGSIHISGRNTKAKGSFNSSNAYEGRLSGHDRDILDLSMSLSRSLAVGDPLIEGAVTNSSDDSSYTFIAMKSPWHSRNLPFEKAGRYTLLSPNNADTGAGFPGGSGAGSLTVSSSGIAKISHYLGDGSRLTWSGRAGSGSQLAIYKTLDRAKPEPSMVSGLLTFRDTAGVSNLDGELFWKRAENRKSAVFPDGFETTRPVIGSIYTAPKGVFGLDGLIETDLNSSMTLSGHGLDENTSLTWSIKNRVTYTPVGRERVITRISLSTGLVSGYWWDRDATNLRLNFRGALFQEQDLVGGYWYYKDGQTGLYQLAPAN